MSNISQDVIIGQIHKKIVSACRDECASKGSSMLCIRDEDTSNYLFSTMNPMDWVWIGYICNKPGSCKDIKNWQWIEGCDSPYMNSLFMPNSQTQIYAYAVRYDGKKFWETLDNRNQARCGCEYSRYPINSPSLFQENMDAVNSSLILSISKSSTSSNAPTLLISSDHDTEKMYYASIIIIMFAVLYMCYYFVGKGNSQHEYTVIVDAEDNNTYTTDKL